ncbi:MAG: sensor histidine kinase [Actinomycetota bacterium]
MDRLWRIYLAAGIAALAAYLAVPTVAGKDVVYLSIVASSAAATLATDARRAAGNRGPRLLLGGGLLLWLGGETYWTIYETILHREPPFPSVADVMFLAAYPLFAIALVWLIGGWRANRSAIIEAIAVAGGAGCAMWVFFADGYYASAHGVLTKVVALGTPVADLVLLGTLTCAFILPGRRSTATTWLLGGVVSTLVADIAFSIQQLDGTYRTGALLDLGWIAFYIAWGVAALHPSMDDAPVRHVDPVPRYGPRRLTVLLAAGVAAPITLLHDVTTGERAEVPVLAVLCVVMFGLVAARIAWLWRMAARDATLLADRTIDLETALDRLQRLGRQRRELLRATVRAAEEERMRVAADIHDGPVQKLTAMTLRAGAVEVRLKAAGNDGAVPPIVELREELSRQVAELRRVIADLRPPELDDGLPGALRGLVDGFGRRTDAVVRLHSDDSARAEPDVETILFRVTQEALSNVRKHANARTVDVAVRVRPDGAGVTVRDDGEGFDPPKNGELVRQGHFGLAGMRERVETAGGTFTVTSGPGAGSEIAAWIPASGDGPHRPSASSRSTAETPRERGGARASA